LLILQNTDNMLPVSISHLF